MEIWEFIAPMTLGIALFIAIVTIVRTITSGRQVRTAVEKKSELQQNILKQFEEGEELNQFLNTPAGKEFVATAEIPLDNNPYTSILRSVRGGIIAVALGGAFYFLDDQVGGEGLNIVGILLTVAGLAVMLAAGVSYFLSQKWGLLRQPESDGTMDS